MRDRILRLRRAWLDLILSGTKTAEVRRGATTPGGVWLGCGGRVEAFALLGLPVRVANFAEFQSRFEEHRVDVPALPYGPCTYLWPLTDVRILPAPVCYHNRAGYMLVVVAKKLQPACTFCCTVEVDKERGDPLRLPSGRRSLVILGRRSLAGHRDTTSWPPQCLVSYSVSFPLSFAMPASTAAAAGCADIRNSLCSAGSSSRPGASAAEGLTSQQKQALRNWCSAAAAGAAQAWREFRPGSGLLYLEANVRLLPVEFQNAFGLATPAAADLQDFRTAVLAALQTALDWYEHVVPACPFDVSDTDCSADSEGAAEADFAVVVAAWLAGDATGAPRRARRLFAARSAGAAEFSEAVLENVYAKLTGADLLRGLTAAPSTARIACCTTTCTLCGVDLEIGETRSTYALTWATGLQRVHYERRRCPECLCHYSSCWRTGRTGSLFLCSTPLHLDFLQFLAHPQHDACAFIDCRLLNFCTSLVVRLRASFIGIVQVLQDTMAAGLSLPLRQELFQLWMFWRSLAIIPAADLTDIPFVFSHHGRQELRAWLVRVHVLLQDRHLRYLARDHWCAVCARCPSVGIDGKMSVSAAVCASLDGPDWTCRYSGLQRFPGCWLPPQRRSRFCRQHAGSGPDLGDFLCPAEHVLGFLPDSAQRRHCCDVCACTLAADQPLWRCEVCDFDVCVACAEDPQRVPSSAVAQASASPAASIEPVAENELNSCGIVKRLPVSRLRRQGGVLTAMLACGRVAHLQLLAGAESATQVTMLLADLRAVRSFNYIIYDDACHLARFVRNRARRSPRSVLCQLAEATYVI
ncbi:unnamed protein product, partial [Symbiodinium necroappetens]